MDPIDILPPLDPLVALKIDSNTFEVRIENHQTLNDVFALLIKHNIRVHSMRNKTNRLEELFMDLITHDH